MYVSIIVHTKPTHKVTGTPSKTEKTLQESDKANAAIDDIKFDPTIRVGMSNRKPPVPDSPGWMIVQKHMEKYKKEQEEKKKEVQAGGRKS
ncbi:hypothetical protein BPAE_0236g00010 [Botrytis paeoniae]|uniref:Uncharacterized protein n=1 Tax=Botrytis paeoniae TaxID=278948 RepID=A0A4Z1FCE6_9HELO|nr:hypothetical protein BPAE_0236g00010 [Botrytis paeoniae]